MSHDFAANACLAQNQTRTGILAYIIDNWRARRSVQTLLKLNDHALYDMGTTRAEVEWAAGLPLSVNAAAVLEEKVRMGGRR
jgi:uncharacterized protein YjiS (DUF1127 family)